MHKKHISDLHPRMKIRDYINDYNVNTYIVLLLSLKHLFEEVIITILVNFFH
jgi:hypothetical protein